MTAEDVDVARDLTRWQYTGHGLQVASEDSPDGAVVVLRGLDEAASGSVEHAVDATPWRGRRVLLRARVATEDVTGHAGLLLRAAGDDDVTLALGDMPGRGPTGTTAAAPFGVEVDVPQDAVSLVLGVERFGAGTVRCGDLQLEDAGPASGQPRPVTQAVVDLAPRDETADQAPRRRPRRRRDSATPATEIPDSPAGRQLSWLLEVWSRRAEGLTPAELEAHVAEAGRRRGFAWTAASMRRIGLELHPTTISRIDVRRPHRGSVTVRDALGRDRSIVVAVDAAEPHRISGFQVLGFSQRAQRRQAQLTRQGKASRNRLIRTLLADVVRGIAKPFRRRSAAGIVTDADDRRAEVAAVTTKIGVRIGAVNLRTRGAGAERREEALEAAATRSAEDLFKVMGNMKGALMKIAQFASYTVDTLPEPFEQELSKLQQAAPPMTWDLVASVVRDELGAPPDELFASIDREPLAAASVGQVHRATTKDGLEVAVKVQYPGVDKAIMADLANAEMLMKSAAGMFGDGNDPKPILDELVARAVEELDYRQEAANQRWFAGRWRGHRYVKIPDPVDALSSSKVLTTELVRGRRFYDVLADPQDARDRMGEIMYRFALTSVFVDGVFSGDPHPGNYVFMDDGRVCFLDYGMVKRVETEAERTLLRAPLVGLLRGERPPLPAELLGSADGAEDGIHRYFAGLFGLVLSDLPVRFTRASVTESMTRNSPPPGPGQRRQQRALGAAPVLGVFTRYVFGTHAVLGHLEAEANWHRIVREVVLGDEPSTEIGRAWASG